MEKTKIEFTQEEMKTMVQLLNRVTTKGLDEAQALLILANKFVAKEEVKEKVKEEVKEKVGKGVKEKA